MKRVIAPLLFVCTITSCVHYANFETTVNKENATKDGIYLDQYVVNLSYDRILELDTKRVQIKGKYTLVKAPESTPERPIQSRGVDTKHILNPKVKIID